MQWNLVMNDDECNYIYIYEHTHMHVVISLGMHHLSPAYDTFFLYTHVHPKSNPSEDRFQSPPSEAFVPELLCWNI